jgi:hydrogenase maturation protein HypF
LFDAVAALTLGIEESAYEGFPAMLLESACDGSEGFAYPLPLSSDSTPELDWRPLIAEILKDRAAGTAAGSMALRFHGALAKGIVSVCRRYEHLPVVLAGGVFQNRILTERVVHLLHVCGQPVGSPGTIPPGDGGLAAGQLAVAAAQHCMNNLASIRAAPCA